MAGMGGLTDDQHRLFEARLKRISRGGPNTAGQMIIGPAEVDKSPKRQRRIRKPGDLLSRLGGAIGHVFVVPVSFALGGAAMLAGLVGAHHLELAGLPALAEAGFLEQAVVYQEFLIAGIVVLIFGGLLRLTQGPRKLAVITGLVAVFILQDQIIASNPEVFSRLMPETPINLSELAALPEF